MYIKANVKVDNGFGNHSPMQRTESFVKCLQIQSSETNL